MKREIALSAGQSRARLLWRYPIDQRARVDRQVGD